MSTLPAKASHLFIAAPPLTKDGKKPGISKILIANRGEIACRVIKTCRLLGITSVAPYVDEDVPSRHITEVNEAVHIGSVEDLSEDPYTYAERLVDIAIAVGANAVHPGCGYLADHAYFADAVRRAGLTFIGSRRRTLSPERCRTYVSRCAPDWPFLPSFAGSCKRSAELQAAATTIGYPVSFKTSAGATLGLAHNAAELELCIEMVRSKAQSSADDIIFSIEKQVKSAKHVNTHIVGDHYDHILCFMDTDCSVRKESQSIIEEAPCSWLSNELRHSMRDTAVQVAELLEFEGIGAVEFVVDTETDHFYFLKVNAGLQAEHAVVEEVTGYDLIALQIFVAAGGNLHEIPSLQHISQRGHALQCELIAEQEKRRQPGVIHFWQSRKPPDGAAYRVRCETAVLTGSCVSRQSGLLIAKLIVWAPSRGETIEGLTWLLRTTACIGIKTNQEFLQSALLCAAFSDRSYTSSLLEVEKRMLARNPYTMGSTQLHDLVMLVPCLYEVGIAQHGAGDSGWKKALETLRTNFRREHCEPQVSTVRVISEVGKEDPLQATVVATLEYSHDTCWASSLLAYPLSTFETYARPEANASMGNRRATTPSAMFNALSAALRSGSTGSWQPYGATVSNFRLSHCSSVRNSTKKALPVASFDACVDGLKTEVHVVRDLRKNVLQCHLSAIGTWISLRSDSLLEFFGSLAARSPVLEAPYSSGVASVRLGMYQRSAFVRSSPVLETA